MSVKLGNVPQICKDCPEIFLNSLLILKQALEKLTIHQEHLHFCVAQVKYFRV